MRALRTSSVKSVFPGTTKQTDRHVLNSRLMADPPILTISATAPPPDWALCEGYLLDGSYPAAMEFVAGQFREL